MVRRRAFLLRSWRHAEWSRLAAFERPGRLTSTPRDGSCPGGGIVGGGAWGACPHPGGGGALDVSRVCGNRGPSTTGCGSALARARSAAVGAPMGPPVGCLRGLAATGILLADAALEGSSWCACHCRRPAWRRPPRSWMAAGSMGGTPRSLERVRPPCLWTSKVGPRRRSAGRIALATDCEQLCLGAAKLARSWGAVALAARCACGAGGVGGLR